MKKNIRICKVLKYAVKIGTLVLGFVALIGCGSDGSSTSSKITTVTRLGNSNIEVN